MKILLATDGSEYSLAAARECCETITLDADTTIKIISIGAQIVSTMQFEDSDGYLVIAQESELKTAEANVEVTQNEIRKALGERNVTIETILKVFRALNAKINFNVELLNQNLNLT